MSSPNNSPHILNTSSNLLGFTFLILSSIKAVGLPQTGYIDEIVAFCVASFAVASYFSFISMRTLDDHESTQFEKIADYIFLGGITLLTIT